MERLRPDDHFLVLLEGDETPMHIGSLLVLDCEGLDTFVAIDRLRSELIRRLPRTPLLRRLVRAPLGFGLLDLLRLRHVTRLVRRCGLPLRSRARERAFL